MQSPDLNGIENYLEQDPLLKKLYLEHRELERKISKLEKKLFLSVAEQKEEAELKKLKLVGKDRMIRLLEKYRHG